MWFTGMTIHYNANTTQHLCNYKFIIEDSCVGCTNTNKSLIFWYLCML